MIARFWARGFRCLKDVDLRFAPLHALVGPNDSGKSTILHALLELHGVLEGRGTQSPPPLELGLVDDTGAGVGFDWSTPHAADFRRFRIESVGKGARTKLKRVDLQPGEERALAARYVPPTLLRLDPDALRQASPLILEGARLRFADARGTGLASVYDGLRNRGDGSYERVASDVGRLFPHVRYLQMVNVQREADGAVDKVLRIELRDGTRVPAESMSEGLLYYLAFAALPHMDAGSFVLIEEPENGLHPARIAEVVRLLRDLTVNSGVQVLLATHSPLVLNELRPEEVSVVTRDAAQGTRVTPLQATPNFEQRAKAYALGELWLAYCNGTDEGPLLKGGPREVPRSEAAR